MTKRHEHWCPVAQTSGLIDVDCTCGAERPGPSYDALRAALARLVAAAEPFASLALRAASTRGKKLVEELMEESKDIGAAIAAAQEALRE